MSAHGKPPSVTCTCVCTPCRPDAFGMARHDRCATPCERAHRVIGEFSGDPSCVVCHHSWPCPTARAKDSQQSSGGAA